MPIRNSATRKSRPRPTSFRKLKEFGVDEVLVGYKNSPTAVIGVINPKKGNAIGLRADIDALPIKENTGLAFESKAKGKDVGQNVRRVSHVRSRHAHGDASVDRPYSGRTQGRRPAQGCAGLSASRGIRLQIRSWRTKPKLSGARALVEDGLLEQFGIKQMNGIHVMARVPAGKMLVAPRNGSEFLRRLPN